MAKQWREIGGRQNSTQIKVDDHVGQVTAGIYKGKEAFASQYTGKDQYKYYIEIKGELCHFYGKTVLNTKMQDVAEGEDVELTYVGKTKGKKYSYDDFKVRAAEAEGTQLRSVLSSVKKPAPKAATDEGEVDPDDIPF